MLEEKYVHDIPSTSLSVYARLSGPRGPMGGSRGPAIPQARPPWSRGPMVGLTPYSLFTSILLHTHSLGRNKLDVFKPTLTGGWEEGAPSVGRPVTS